MLGRQVENRMRASIKEVADLWYTAWVDAGQPDLDALLDFKLSEEDLKEMEEERKSWQQKTLQVRPEETSSLRELDVSTLYGFSSCCRHEEEGHQHP
jgi:chromatin segregation and condensation protein Rec8/ScpA/Scc1 (kleisin family)